MEKNIYYEMLLSEYSKKVSKKYTDHKGRSLAALAINELLCLCVPDFGIATGPGLDLKL